MHVYFSFTHSVSSFPLFPISFLAHLSQTPLSSLDFLLPFSVLQCKQGCPLHFNSFNDFNTILPFFLSFSLQSQLFASLPNIALHLSISSPMLPSSNTVLSLLPLIPMSSLPIVLTIYNLSLPSTTDIESAYYTAHETVTK